MQVGGIADVVLCVDGIGILPLGDLESSVASRKGTPFRIARHIGVVGDIVDIVPDGRALL